MISEIEKNFYRITLRMPYRLKHVNAYLLAHDKELALFDTGLNITGAYEYLANDMANKGLNINNIKKVFLTHVHTDHCSMAGVLQKKTGAKVYLSKAAFEEYQHFCKADSTVKQLKKFYSRQGMGSRQIDAVIEEYEIIRDIIDEFNTDNFLQNNETHDFGDWKFEVIFTPGHAAGHTCFFFRKKSFLLAGDHILPYIAPILSPDIFDDNFRPLATYLDSLNVIEKLPAVTVYPGHGNAFIDLKERLEDIRKHHEKRKRMIWGCLNSEPKTAYTISSEISVSAVHNFEKFMALNETIVYLKELKAEGAIKEDMTDNVLFYTRIKNTG
ncbi:MAG: MBL fold metallo-hydrolase [Deltaproteobacteria bacterium]|nr:MBL fold metallo-hydrolase [Deltaproteobacteria bacterium]